MSLPIVPPPPYVHQAYPKWRYRGGAARIVQTPAEAIALGDGWSDTPQTALPPAPATGAATLGQLGDAASGAGLYDVEAADLVSTIAVSLDAVGLEAILKVEANHPTIAGGRPEVRKAIGSRLVALAKKQPK